MSLQCFEAVRALVLEKAARGQTIDVYAVAHEFHKKYPDCSEAELVRLVNTIVVTAPGATAVWLKPQDAE